MHNKGFIDLLMLFLPTFSLFHSFIHSLIPILENMFLYGLLLINNLHCVIGYCQHQDHKLLWSVKRKIVFMNSRMIMIHIEEMHKIWSINMSLILCHKDAHWFLLCSFAIIKTHSITIKISPLFNLYFALSSRHWIEGDVSSGIE